MDKNNKNSKWEIMNCFVENIIIAALNQNYIKKVIIPNINENPYLNFPRFIQQILSKVKIF